MTWVAVAIGGAALIGGAASYAGSKKQSDAATKAAQLNQGQYQNNVQMEQPFVSSGYGALSKLNTLMGINPNPNAAPNNFMDTGVAHPTGQHINPNDFMDRNPAPAGMTWNGPQQMLTNLVAQRKNITDPKPSTNPQLRQILQIRADNGDPQAKQMLGMIQ